MNIYSNLNKMIDYIESHLDEEISYDKLSQLLGVNPYMMQRLFTILCDISITEYIKNRRLSNAGFDLYQTNNKVIDVALKCHYDNPTSFSRAFEKFHGIKPSQVKEHPEKLKLFAKFTFNEAITDTNKIEYSIIKMDELILYGKGVPTTNQTIKKDAPKHFQNISEQFSSQYGGIKYGMIIYSDQFRAACSEYWVLYDKEIPGFNKYVIPKSKWLVFSTSSQNAEDIQRTSDEFYVDFMPSCQYHFREIPELEYYHDGITDFLVPIED